MSTVGENFERFFLRKIIFNDKTFESSKGIPYLLIYKKMIIVSWFLETRSKGNRNVYPAAINEDEATGRRVRSKPLSCVEIGILVSGNRRIFDKVYPKQA